MLRPHLLVVIAGTGTDVGKTWVGCELARELQAGGLRVAARKPVQSFDPADGLTDADRLAEATAEQATDVCPRHRWYPKAMAPPMAAEHLGLPPFTLVDLVSELAWPSQADVGLVELAGGARAPLAADGDCADLVELLSPDLVVLVTGSGLGILSDVRLAAGALGAVRAQPPIVYLNLFDPTQELHVRNRDWLAQRDNMVVAVSPRQLAGPVAAFKPGRAGAGPS
ncbi:MAG TPA: dethiobiotin synthase [Acidimicrobiales bacterium]|nr:dethiobiotin synthase [Acidimicrobiales bacterium]